MCHHLSGTHGEAEAQRGSVTHEDHAAGKQKTRGLNPDPVAPGPAPLTTLLAGPVAGAGWWTWRAARPTPRPPGAWGSRADLTHRETGPGPGDTGGDEKQTAPSFPQRRRARESPTGAWHCSRP